MKLDSFYTVDPLPFAQAHNRQRAIHSRRVAGEIPDTLWLLEHLPVITTGIRLNQEEDVLIDPEETGIEVIQTERGGETTYHGPGQLVGYLFIDIANFGFQVRNFVGKIEESLISYLATFHDITARHDAHHTGVWVGMNKIAAIGISLRRGVTMHGFALNVNTNLEHFDWIIPCGIRDPERGVTSLEQLLKRRVSLCQVAEGVSAIFRETLGYAPAGMRIESKAPQSDDGFG